MRRNSLTWPVYSANTQKKSIDPKPPYQRGLVWSRNQKQLFMDSIFRDYDIPKLYLRRIFDIESPYKWEIVDGQQRLTAIWEFLGGEYPVSTDSDPVGGYEIAGKFFKELEENVKQQLLGYTLDLVELEESEDREIEEMFIRLQNGVPLNSAEKRNAISGEIRDFVRDTASTHELMTKSIAIRDRRHAHDELISQMLLIELSGGPTLITHAKLRNLYEYKQFDRNSPRARKFKRVINFLARAFPEKSPELATKVNLTTLYTVASESLEKYAIATRPKAFSKWFTDFERRRKSIENIPEDQIDEDMRSYQYVVIQATQSLASQQERRRILMRDMLATISDLKLLDDQRQFTQEQRLAIFYKSDDGKCVNPNDNPECDTVCTWENFHADHILPHSKGGETTVANGQLLCPSCNLKKSDSLPAA